MSAKIMNLGQLPIAAFALNQNGKVLAWNEAAEELLGKPASQVIGKKGWNLFNHGGKENPLKESFLSGESSEIQLDVNENGITLSGKPQENADGEVSIVVFTATKTPQDSQRLQETLDAIDKSQARIEFQLDGTIITANDNFLAAVGYSLNEVQGKHHSMFVESTYASGREYKEFWNKLNRGEFDSGEYKRLGKGGTEIWIQAAYNPIFDDSGRPFKVVKFATDITQQKLENANFRGQMDAVSKSQGVIEFNMSGEILTANENFLSAVGYTMEEIQGKHHRIFVDDEYAASSEYRNFWQRLNRGEFEQAEYRRIGKGGKVIWIQASYNPILDLNGRPFKVVKYATEITDAVNTRSNALAIQGVVDNSPNPTMLIDLESFTIAYANPIALKTLERLEDFIPVKSNEIVGTCIDVLHKEAHLQRKLLGDPKNLPHEARIEVGPETVQLQVYGLFDENGQYTAPALSWNIITAQVELERRDAAAKRAVGIVQTALMQVAEGNVEVEISEDFEGDLNEMRDNVNGIAELLRRFKTVMDSLAEHARTGNLEERADASQFQGAYGEIISGVNNTLDAIMGPVANIRRKLTMVATGDLTAYVTEEYEGDHAALKNALNGTLDGLNDLLGQVTNSADQIASSSGQVAAAAQDLSQGASEQAATIEEISAQMSQITTQTSQNAENATQANQLAVTARDGARAGDERMNEMLGAMREIEEASTNISKIIKVIDEIAFQTNLLALNAAVEAARAGVHGKGFAVVAEEVRNLAARSARAAKETTDMIEGSIKKVSLGTNIAQETAAALGAIVSDVGKVTDLVAEIAAASNEQAEGINQVNGGLDQVNQVTQRNTATSEESAASAEEMNGQTGEMQAMIGKFQLSEVTAQAPEGMTPEMMAMLQGYVEKMMGKQSAAGVLQSAARVVQSASAPAEDPLRNMPNISLNSGDFGKY